MNVAVGTDVALAVPVRSGADTPPPPVVGERSGRTAEWALLLTAIAYAVSQFQLWRINLGWDETIYFSQVSRAAPAAFFSAPRARGITWLAEPLALVSSSVPALRIYLTVLSAMALYLAFRVWFKVLAPGAVVIAALLLGSLWITRFYGAELMPNLWVAFGAVAAVGGFLRLAHDHRDRIGLIALPAGLALAALMRPSDAVWVAVPLLVMALLVPAWRRTGRIYLIVLVGAGLGALPWVIEAYQRFGGVPARLHRASEIQGGLGWHPEVLLQHWQTLDGPLLCRPCSPPSSPPLDTFWFLLLVPVALLAVLLVWCRPGPIRRVSAGRKAGSASGRRGNGGAADVVVPTVVGLSLSVPYLLLVSYSAPRFLLPAFALLALPFGVLVWWLVTAAARLGPARYVLIVALVLALAGQMFGQQAILNHRVAEGIDSGNDYTGVAAQLRGFGLSAPCVVTGHHAAPVGYYAGCSSRDTGGHDGSITREALAELALHEPTALIILDTQRRPHYAKTWTRHLLAEAPDDLPWVVYLSPSVR